MTPKSVDNQAIEVDVRKAVAGAVTDKTFGIEVNVEGSVVTLSGNVDTSEERSKIVAAARSVDGVSRVIDQLHVK